MAVQTLNLYPFASDTTFFRSWGSAISTALNAVGLVKTADTGQIDWTTVQGTTTTNQKRGYEIWRFADSLQATRPVFIKLEYGSGANTTNPQIWLTVGTATDGAGTITAHPSFPNSVTPVRSTLWQTSSAFYSGTATSPVYVDSDGGGSVMLSGWYIVPGSSNPTYAAFLLLVERTRNWDGTPNGEGAWVFSSNFAGYNWSDMVLFGASSQYAVRPQMSGGGAMYPWGASSSYAPTPNVGFVGGVQYFLPVFTGFTPQMHGPSKHVVAMLPSDLPVMTQLDLTHYGALKRWVVSGTVGIDLQTASLRAVVRIS